MTAKFSAVPAADHEMCILNEEEIKLGDLDVLYQMWMWDGITAESLIFDNNDIVGMSDADIHTVINKSPRITTDSTVEITRSTSGYTFVHFSAAAE